MFPGDLKNTHCMLATFKYNYVYMLSHDDAIWGYFKIVPNNIQPLSLHNI